MFVPTPATYPLFPFPPRFADVSPVQSSFLSQPGAPANLFPVSTPKHSSHHRRCSSVSTRHESADLPPSPPCVPTPPQLPLSHFASFQRLTELKIDLPESVIFDNPYATHLTTTADDTWIGGSHTTSRCEHLHTLELALTAGAGSDGVLNVHGVSSVLLY